MIPLSETNKQQFILLKDQEKGFWKSLQILARIFLTSQNPKEMIFRNISQKKINSTAFGDPRSAPTNLASPKSGCLDQTELGPSGPLNPDSPDGIST